MGTLSRVCLSKSQAEKLTSIICGCSLVPRPRLPEKERAWYPLFAHARNYLGQDEGGGAYDAGHGHVPML